MILVFIMEHHHDDSKSRPHVHPTPDLAEAIQALHCFASPSLSFSSLLIPPSLALQHREFGMPKVGSALPTQDPTARSGHSQPPLFFIPISRERSF